MPTLKGEAVAETILAHLKRISGASESVVSIVSFA
jgi:hypothetical protein